VRAVPRHILAAQVRSAPGLPRPVPGDAGVITVRELGSCSGRRMSTGLWSIVGVSSHATPTRLSSSDSPPGQMDWSLAGAFSYGDLLDRNGEPCLLALVAQIAEDGVTLVGPLGHTGSAWVCAQSGRVVPAAGPHARGSEGQAVRRGEHLDVDALAAVLVRAPQIDPAVGPAGSHGWARCGTPVGSACRQDAQVGVLGGASGKQVSAQPPAPMRPARRGPRADTGRPSRCRSSCPPRVGPVGCRRGTSAGPAPRAGSSPAPGVARGCRGAVARRPAAATRTAPSPRRWGARRCR
jgi:hypothetical protein